MPAAGLWKNHYTGNDYCWPAYTTDINTQAPYFSTYGTNHPNVASAMYQVNLDFIPPGQALSQLSFSCPGIIQPVEIGARGALFILSDQGIRSNAILAGMIFIISTSRRWTTSGSRMWGTSTSRRWCSGGSASCGRTRAASTRT